MRDLREEFAADIKRYAPLKAWISKRTGRDADIVRLWPGMVDGAMAHGSPVIPELELEIRYLVDGQGTIGAPWWMRLTDEQATEALDEILGILLPRASDAPQRYRDCENDIWEDAGEGHVRIVQYHDEPSQRVVGVPTLKASVEHNCGPLVPISEEN